MHGWGYLQVKKIVNKKHGVIGYMRKGLSAEEYATYLLF